MDKRKHIEWMCLEDRLNRAFKSGLKNFLDFAFSKANGSSVIPCPCIDCKNSSYHDRVTVGNHVIIRGILQDYTVWYFHGESLLDLEEDNVGQEDETQSDEIREMLQDMFPGFGELGDMETTDDTHAEDPNDNAKIFYRLLKENDQPLFKGSKCSKLSVLVKLLHIKSIGQWSNESFSMLLDLLKKEILPSDSCLPDSYYEAKKLFRDLGLSYERIDACPNDCMLYWKDNANLESCKVCKVSRWKEDRRSGELKRDKKGKKVPVKILRYFPLKPRLQRLFMCNKIASLMS